MYNSESTGHIVLKTVLYLIHIFDTEKFAGTKLKVKALMTVIAKINLEYSLKVVNRKSSFEDARNFSQQLIFYMIQKAFFLWWLIFSVFFKSFGYRRQKMTSVTVRFFHSLSIFIIFSFFCNIFIISIRILIFKVAIWHIQRTTIFKRTGIYFS